MHPAQKRERIILRLSLASLFASLLLGCQSTREQLTAQGYPAPFIDGFEAGCSSGRQAAGALQTFRKDVPRYLQQPEYTTGWDDGFRQCKAAVESDLQRQWHEQDHHDEDWRSHVNQSMANALREHQDRQ
jgi:hypothetical protein